MRRRSQRSKRITEVSALGAKTNNNEVSKLGVEEAEEKIESISDAIGCWWRLDNMLG